MTKYSENLAHFGERQRELLRLLIRNRSGLTVEELTEKLNITRTAVKQHLLALKKESYVARGVERSTRGRPSIAYQITARGIDLFPKQYSWFSGLLLKSIRRLMKESGLAGSMRELADEVSESLMERTRHLSGDKKISEISAILSDLGYETGEKKSSESPFPIIEAHNCVYHDLAREDSDVCEFDRQILRKLSGMEVHHDECMVRGGSCCRFRFSKPE